MRRCVIFLTCVLALLAAIVPEAYAAKKKAVAPARQPSLAKPIYDAPMTVSIVRAWSQTCEPTCPEWISAEGEITNATPAAFARVFKAMGKKRLPIVIRSPGGSINAAVDIGHMIRKRGFDVAVGATMFQGCAPNEKSCKLPGDQNGIYRGAAIDYGGFCNSACPLILASGKLRLAAIGTTIGVHQPKTIWTQQRYTYRETYRIINGKKKILSRKIINRSNAGTKVTFGYDKRLRTRLTRFYREMGVDVAILAESDKASFQNMNSLKGQRLNELHLRTAPNTVAMLTQPSICKSDPVPVNCIKGPKIVVAPQAETKTGLSIGILADDPAMVFAIVRNHNDACEPVCPAWIAADGVITKRTPGEFKLLLQRLGKKKLPIVFNSPGGDLDAALALGAAIRGEHLSTVIAQTKTQGCGLHAENCGTGFRSGRLEAGRCNGACVVAFAGGERRSNALESIVLIHAPGNDDRPGQQQTSAVKLFTFFSRMGIGKRLMDRVNEASGTAQSSIDQTNQSKALLVNEENFKTIVSTPARCKQSGENAMCLKSTI
jgi:hypothetical protein